MRILVLSNLYPPRVIGGYELYCEGIVDYLHGCGHSVTVLTSKGPPARNQEHVRRELSLYIKGDRTRQPHPVRRLPREFSDHRALREVEDWDVAVVFHMVGLAKSLLTALHMRGPVAYVVGDLWPAWDLLNDTWLGRLHPEGPPGSPPGGIPRLRFPSYVARALAPVVNRMGVPVQWPNLFAEGHWWANSQWTLDSLVQQRGLPLNDARVIRHGIPVDMFPMREEGEIGRRLLYVGRINAQKGVDVALAAQAQMPDSQLTLVGHADPEYLKGVHLPLEVELRAPVLRERLAAAYAAHDVLLFPVTWHEPLGLVPLEAMACGLPVVATGTGGSAEYLVPERNCLLVEPGDAAGLAAAAERILEDVDLRRTLISNGRRTAEENSLVASARLTDEALQGMALAGGGS